MPRNAKACLACRLRKHRCRIEKRLPGLACAPCQSRRIVCSLTITQVDRAFDQGPKPLAAILSTPLLSSESDATTAFRSADLLDEDVMPPLDVCRDLIDVYFDTLDHTLGSLFHRVSFMEDFVEQKVPRIILFSVFSLTARFSEHVYFEGIGRWQRSERWSSEAWKLLNLAKVDVSVTTLQACHLLLSLAAAEGDKDGEAVVSAVANRVVQLLDLPVRLSANPLQRELEIRVWSTIYMADIWCSIPRRIKPTVELDPSPPWPIEELAFAKMRTTDTVHYEPLDKEAPLRASCLWAQMIPLTCIASRIHSLNLSPDSSNVALCPQTLASVSQLSQELDGWTLRLPSRLQESQSNLAYFCNHGLGNTFVALHIGYHYHGMLLHYRFLSIGGNGHGFQEHERFFRRCKYHAAALSELSWSSYHDYKINCAWLMISHIMVIASSVHLHTLLLDDDEDARRKAKQLLEQNFQTLLRLRQFWPWLDQCMERLKMFHDVCFRAWDKTDAFRMTRWLVQFLESYANPIEACEEVAATMPESDLFDFRVWSIPTTQA